MTTPKKNEEMATNDKYKDRKTPLAARADEWLSTTGFALEFEAATTFRKREFLVGQGLHVKDPNDGKPAELDVVAARHTGTAWLDVDVECKHLTEPWIAFRAPPPPGNPSTAYAAMRGTAEAEAEDSVVAAMHDVRNARPWVGVPAVQLRPMRVPTRDTEASFTVFTGLAMKALARRDHIPSRVLRNAPSWRS